MIKKAVILAGGFGTRLLPITKSIPKAMLPIVDKPALQYIIEEIVESGIKDILIVTSKNNEIIKQYFDTITELEEILEKNKKYDLLKTIKNLSNLANIQYVVQEEAKGSGHALLHAKEFVGNNSFALLLGDAIIYNKGTSCIKQMIDIYNEYQTTILGIRRVEDKEVSKYGIIKSQKISEDIFSVIDIIEKPSILEAASNLATSGRYILKASIFDILTRTKPGIDDEIQITDAIRIQNKLENIHAYIYQGERYDTGCKLGLLKANVETALRHPDLADDFLEYLIKTINKKNKNIKFKYK